MIKELARDAVKIKMAAQKESPLISAFEFCYAAGLACRILRAPDSDVRRIADTDDFLSLRRQIQEMAKGREEAFEVYPNGARLYRLIVGCRFNGKMEKEARELFEMGYRAEMQQK